MIDELSGSAPKGSTGPGVCFALGAAAVSGVSVWLNAQVLSRADVFGDPGTYTMAKNLVAGATIAVIALVLARGGSAHGFVLPSQRSQMWALVAVGFVGGSIPFLLFFEGLARSGAPGEAQLLHKAGLLVLVTVLAPSVLRERLGTLQMAGVTLVLVGYWILSSGPQGAVLGAGGLLVLAASACWAVESVVDRWLLAEVTPATLGSFRLLGGLAVLLVIGGFNGDTAGLLGIGLLGWALASLTGLVLACYVGLWLYALRGAQAVDVTAILTLAAPVTAATMLLIDGVGVTETPGLMLIACGVAGVAAAALVRARRGRRQVMAAL